MIGIFDSGIGGLTVVKEIIKKLPLYDLVYFGDTARSPYGDKSNEIIEEYTRDDVELLLSKGAQLIVTACHSSSIIAREFISNEVEVPIFDMVEPTVRAAVAATRNGRIGILGTRATVGSELYNQAILDYTKNLNSKDDEQKLKMPAYARKKNSKKKVKIYKVFSQAAPLLVPLVEEGWIGKPETNRILKSYLRPLKEKQIDTLILACTHYPLLKKMIEPRIGKNVKVIDPGRQVAFELEHFLRNNPDIESQLGRAKKRSFFVSDISPHFEKIAGKWLGQPIVLKKI